MGITNPGEEYFKDGGWSWDGTTWVKDNLPLGYRDRWAEDIGSVQGSDAAWFAGTVVVPAGYVYVAQFMFIRNTTGARGARYMAFKDGTNYYYTVYNNTPARYVPDIWNGGVVMKAGDSVFMYQSTCLTGDTIQAGVWGYKVKVT